MGSERPLVRRHSPFPTSHFLLPISHFPPSDYAAIASSRATRSSVGGWVENSLLIPPP